MTRLFIRPIKCAALSFSVSIRAELLVSFRSSSSISSPAGVVSPEVGVDSSAGRVVLRAF